MGTVEAIFFGGDVALRNSDALFSATSGFFTSSALDGGAGFATESDGWASAESVFFATEEEEAAADKEGFLVILRVVTGADGLRAAVESRRPRSPIVVTTVVLAVLMLAAVVFEGELRGLLVGDEVFLVAPGVAAVSPALTSPADVTPSISDEPPPPAQLDATLALTPDSRLSEGLRSMACEKTGVDPRLVISGGGVSCCRALSLSSGSATVLVWPNLRRVSMNEL